MQYKNITRNKRQTTIKTGKKDGKLVKTYTIAPIILGQEFVRQQVEESTDTLGNRRVTQKIQDQKGKTLIE